MNVLDIISARQADTFRQVLQLVGQRPLLDEPSLRHADLAEGVVGGWLGDAKLL